MCSYFAVWITNITSRISHGWFMSCCFGSLHEKWWQTMQQKSGTRSGEHLWFFLSEKKKSSHPTQGEEMILIKNVSDLVWPVTQHQCWPLCLTTMHVFCYKSGQVCIAKKECKEYEWCWKSEWIIDCGSESVFVQVGMKG